MDVTLQGGEEGRTHIKAWLMVCRSYGRRALLWFAVVQASLKKSMDITQNNKMINLGFTQEKQLSAHAKMCEY